jgi:hypothetical protein
MSRYPIASQLVKFDKCVDVRTLHRALRVVEACYVGEYSYWESLRTADDLTFYRLGLKSYSTLSGGTNLAPPVSKDILVVPCDGKDAEWFMQAKSGVIGGVRVKSRALCQDTNESMHNQTEAESSLRTLVGQVARQLQNAVNATIGAEPNLSV